MQRYSILVESRSYLMLPDVCANSLGLHYNFDILFKKKNDNAFERFSLVILNIILFIERIFYKVVKEVT